MDYKIYTADKRDDFGEQARTVITPAWPEFMFHDTYLNEIWHHLYEGFLKYQFMLTDPATDQIVAWSVSMNWYLRKPS